MVPHRLKVNRMAFIELKPEDVAEIPPAPAVQAQYMWISSILIRTPSPQQEGSVALEYFPMTADQEVIARDPDNESLMKTLTTETLFSDIQQVPELAQAFGAILAAVKPLEAFKEQENEGG